MPKGMFVSCLKDRKIISKVCIVQLARVRDLYFETLTLKSLPIVNKFQEVLPDNLPGIPPKREIDFDIELIPATQLISISSYRMAPEEHKILKDQLKDLLDKGISNTSLYFTLQI